MASNMTDHSFSFQLYRYIPSLPAAIVAVCLFTVLTFAHVWRLYRHRTLYFIPFVIGGAFEAVGYAARIWSHFDTTSIGGFVLQAIPILVAPALFAASIYMILGRLIHTLNLHRLSPIPLRWLTKAFVCADILSFSLQAGGGGIQSAGTLQLFDIGEKIIVTGLLLQIVFFSLFVIVTILFDVRVRRLPSNEVPHQSSCPWVRHLLVIYTVSGLILVRSIVRVVEYLQGNSGYLISHEVFLYVFDMALMVLVMLVLFVWYIGDLVSLKQTPPHTASQEKIQV